MDTQPTIPAEKHPKPLTWTAALDNYEPTRGWAKGTATEYDTLDGGRGVRIENGLEALRDSANSLYLVDYGNRVVPCYVAGHHDGRPSPMFPEGHAAYVLVVPFPLSDGRIRPDDGRPVDFSRWMLGPRRAYHLKMRKG